MKRDKSKELKSAELIAAVWARDCTDDPSNPTRGRCRYCARKLLRADKKSDTRPTMDHVDPRKATGATNVVLACWDCNRKKAARTPEQAGMTLLPAPRAAASSEKVSPADAAAETASSSRIKPEDQSDIKQKSTVILDAESLLGRARQGERGGRAGVGQGRVSLSTGLPPGQPAPPRPKPRNRRRGTGKAQTPQLQSSNPHHAGDAPPVAAVGEHGSPWYGWSGKRSAVDETTCDIHHEEQPCRVCIRENT
ncbi:HNH endonuclease [Arthrobacter sp. HLT1-21]